MWREDQTHIIQEYAYARRQDRCCDVLRSVHHLERSRLRPSQPKAEKANREVEEAERKLEKANREAERKLEKANREVEEAERKLEKANREVEEAERKLEKANREVEELQEIEEKRAAKEAERNMRQLALLKEVEEEGPSEKNRQAWEETLSGEQKMWRLLLNLRRAYRKEGETTDEKFLAFVDEKGYDRCGMTLRSAMFPSLDWMIRGNGFICPRLRMCIEINHVFLFKRSRLNCGCILGGE